MESAALHNNALLFEVASLSWKVLLASANTCQYVAGRCTGGNSEGTDAELKMT